MKVAKSIADADASELVDGGRLPRDVPWRDPSLASGHAGIALFAAQLDRCLPGDGWDRVGDRHLRLAVGDGTELRSLGAGLHAGWGGLAFAADALALDGRRYATFLEQAEEALAARALQLAIRVDGLASGIPAPDIDVISGLSGIVAVLLRRRGRSTCDTALQRVVRALVHAGSSGGLQLAPGPLDVRRQADGDPSAPALNLGMAHGLPGLVSALALAVRHGTSLDGSVRAIEAMVATLRTYMYEDDWGPLCPLSVTLDGGPAPRTIPVRTAWCHGVPGLARALWLAGAALDRPEWRTDALHAIRGALRRPVERRSLGSTTFCHGDAGLVQIGLRFLADTGDSALRLALHEEVARLVSSYDPSARFGYRRIDSAGQPCESAGLLDGASGVALVLLAAGCDVEPRWDRAFLLS